jgi:hypothetical protein
LQPGGQRFAHDHFIIDDQDPGVVHGDLLRGRITRATYRWVF